MWNLEILILWAETEAQSLSYVLMEELGFLNSCSDFEAYTLSMAPACHSGNRNNYQIGNFLADLSTHPKFCGYFVLICFILFSWNANPVFSSGSQ